MCHGGMAISLLDARDGRSRSDLRSTGPGWGAYAPRFQGEGTVARRAWRTTYVRSTVVADVLSAGVAACIGYFGRFGNADPGELVSSVVGATFLLPFVW